jgi:hypothetical protein
MSASVVLLTLTYAGRTWRHSSRPVDILEGTTWRHYRGGLAPMDIFEEAPLTGVAEAQSQTVEVLTDSDMADLVSQGHDLSELTAEIALWTSGDFALRDRRLSGAAEVASGGRLGQPLRLRVVADDPTHAPGIWPPPTQQISADTWCNTGSVIRSYDAADEGRTYPQVLGAPGLIWAGSATANGAALPCYPVSLSASGTWAGLMRYTPWGSVEQWGGFGPRQGTFGLLSAGMMYPGPAGVHQGEVYITCDTGSTPIWKIAWLYYAYDALGQVVTLAKIQNPISDWGSITSGRSYYACIAPPCSGIARPDYQGGVTGAGSIIRWALEQTPITVDWRRTIPALAQLDLYELGGFWDQSCSAWQWVAENVLPLLPCSWIPGPDGLYPVVWRLDATAATADARLIDGQTCCIDGEPKIEGADEIRSRWTLDYANGLFAGGTWRARAVWHGQVERASTRESSSLHLRRAQIRWGSARGAQALATEEALTSDLVWSARTADRILSWRSLIYSGTRTVYHVLGDEDHIGWLHPGMVVALTSTRYSLSSRVAHVRRAGKLGALCYADLVILPEA